MFAGSIISITAGNPDREKELRKELNEARIKCLNEDTDEGKSIKGYLKLFSCSEGPR